MKQNMKFAFLLITVLLILLPSMPALALVVNTPVVIDRGEKIASFSMLHVGLAPVEENLTMHLEKSLNKLPIVKDETSLGVQAVLNSAFLQVRGLTDELASTPIPTSVLLLGSGLIGLIGIARRSLFTG